jgi:deoxyribodipyrimidine photo-lyase
LPPPTSLYSPEQFPESEPLDSWELLPAIPWDGGLKKDWTPTQAAANQIVENFLHDAVPDYKIERDFPAKPATSRLSPYLHFGQISPRRIWHAADQRLQEPGAGTGVEAFTRQLVWRDFAVQMLFSHPHTDWEPLQEKYADFPWLEDADALEAWQRGQTGYPIVDAGMRELWHTGWMHNRVRMIVASFLVKDLLISWRAGAEWFWDTLVDADLANNSFGWQWAGGCGADAAPYFRIFNPVRQSERFDPAGDYIRRWVPELRDLNTKDLHAPWATIYAPSDYPSPIVDHKAARDRALEALSTITAS